MPAGRKLVVVGVAHYQTLDANAIIVLDRYKHLGLVDEQVHPLGAGFAWQEWQFLLLFSGLSLHHQDHPPRRAQVYEKNPQRLL